MQCPKCQYENQAGDKFCRECGTKLSYVCPKCGHEANPQDKFCAECGTKLVEDVPTTTEVTVPKLEDMHAQLQNLIPEALAQKYLDAEQQAAGENRLITALFADISGFTTLSAVQSSEVIFQLIQNCFKQLVSIVANYEGSISGFRGDGLLALFGAPILHENDAERAILTAIDMRNAMPERQLEISIGVNTALMTVGEIQTQLHREYTAYGTDINLAKRLQEAAKPGQILIGSGTHRLTHRAFDIETVSSLSLKGFPETVTAHAVQQVKVHPEKLRGIEGLGARMIGREHEFAQLKEAADEWLAGRGRIVSIIGEAGIGKSRLVTELKTYFADEAHNQAQYLEGRCVSIGQPISYWPFSDILRTYFSLSEDDSTQTIARKVTEATENLFPQSSGQVLPFLGNLLSIRFGNDLDDRLKFATPDQIRHQTLMRLRDFCGTLARKQPLMLILEDLHWADDLSLDLLSLLMDELATIPLMLLCVYRPEKEHRVWQLSSQAQRKCLDRYTEIRLQKLSSRESRQLVETLLTIDNLPERVREMILRKSEGNPFFIEEVIRSLIDRDLIYRDSDRWKARDEIAEIDVPDTIQSVLLARVDRLQAEAKYVLQCASVIGRLFKYRLLEHLTQRERELDRYLSEFEERELVYEERTVPELEYAFRHALTQEATYQGIIQRRRREFHLKVAVGIEKLYQERLEEYYEELAYHYSKSDDVEKAVDYLLLAGEKARKVYANNEALAYLNQALDMTSADDWAKRYAILLNRVPIYSIRGQRDAWLKDILTLKELAESLDDDRKRAEVLLLQAQYSMKDDYPAVIVAAQEAINLAQSTGDVSREAEGYQVWGFGLIRQGNSQAAKLQLDRALSLARTIDLAQVEARCLHRIGWYYMGRGRIAEARTSFEEELRIGQRIGDRTEEGGALNCLGIICLLERGDYIEASSYYERFLELSREIGDRGGEALALGNLGVIRSYNKGDYAGAKPYYEEALPIFYEIDEKSLWTWLLTCRGIVSMVRGHYAQATADCEQALCTTREIGNRSMQYRALNSLGQIYLTQGDYVRARDYHEQALKLSREREAKPDESGSLKNLGDICKIQGDYAGARAYYEKALQICRDLSNPKTETELLHKLIDLFLSEGDYAQAQGYCDEALRLSRELGYFMGEYETLMNLGCLRLVQGDYSGAKDYYDQAMDICRKFENWGGECKTLLAMGLLSHNLGDDETARQYLEEALQLTRKLGDFRPEGEALNYLGQALVGLGNLPEAITAYQQSLTRCREFGQPHQAMASLAGLAWVAFTQGNLAQVQEHVEEILDNLDTRVLNLLEPFRVYLICYRILQANHDHRAPKILATAHQLLQERAAKISDEELRRSFLEKVVVHRETVSAFETGE